MDTHKNKLFNFRLKYLQTSENFNFEVFQQEN